MPVLLMMACEKPAGEGGTSVIQGKVMALEGFYSVLTQSFDTTAFYYAEKEDVYIIYGDDKTDIYDDSFETSWDGTYRFEFLRKGTYTLFAYTDCDSCASGTEPIFWQLTIDENNKTYTLEDKVIRK